MGTWDLDLVRKLAALSAYAEVPEDMLMHDPKGGKEAVRLRLAEQIAGIAEATADAEVHWDDVSITRTRHNPGIQPPDVDQAVAATRVEATAAGIEVLVLSRGMESRLGVPKDTIRYAESLGMEVHVAVTEDAVALYNELTVTRAVAALIHSTC
ncbi:MTH938/NDUFAF3 family protein [Myceligenerans pegani]|uniref:Uncharacterized protein n=1 Tax=Myceligenerans pegani TaxID=2776917 RepID=A0ABR9MZU9_9MICO|nr:MTH938/NDUFAF3 family protein [Myceligenerans sp. TRM 65318]MBE1876625.1 hypothetical protein [Myceligenerans sp. TRM 65318]MBE3018896.1 hypothetical protein [Myceligenerans sp. TRM 65318]